MTGVEGETNRLYGPGLMGGVAAAVVEETGCSCGWVRQDRLRKQEVTEERYMMAQRNIEKLI